MTNQNYAAVLTEKILNPLGMNNAGYDTSSGILKNRAYGYERQLNGYINTDYLDMSIPYSAGGYVFNCRNMDIWDEALYLKQLISENMKQKMFQISQFKNYAYGWEVNDIPVFEFGKKLTSITHGGGINAFNSSITRILFKVRA